ncbi:MAG TPA: cyclic nucleotide-binding domain-containing protein [Terriglobales bacterium]|nr:cyclic nucleotide-binding domain-containing protein [Terriglobales bacterium]
MRSTQLFQNVDPLAVEELIAQLSIVKLEDGQVLVSQGDQDPSLYLLMSGRLRVAVSDRRGELHLLYVVNPGESAGEMSILSDDPASGSILSAARSTVLAIPRAAFENFCSKYPKDALHVMQSLSERLQRYHLSLTLHVSDLFEGLDADALHDLGAELEMFTLYGGEVLFQQGDSGDFLCLVVRGRVRVRVRESSGENITIAELGSGEIVGEMGVVTGEFRTESVDALRDSQLARLTRAGFERFMAKHPREAVNTFSRKLAGRLKDASGGSNRRSRTITCVAVVPAHADAPLSEFCAALRQALSRFGRAVHLSSALVDQHLGREGIAQTYERSGANIRVVEWLSELELASDYVVYEADQFLSPWGERCIRQADHVLVVGDAKGDPIPGEIEAELLGTRDASDYSRAWLVLVHEEEAPSGTKRWLDARPVERHFHVRLEQNEDVERVARFMTGRAVGLTLGGGFARALAHVGVFRAFADLGVGIDAIGGSSMGAMVGALLAMNWEAERIVQEISAGCANPYFGDLTFPFIAFKTGKSLSALIRRLFADIQIEDLWMPYFCISANLNRSELKIHSRGPLARAVLATTRAPGLFPPVVDEGELHVDGGVINNVPVDIMKTFSNEGITVGVDISPPHELYPIRDYGDTVSGWQAFWKRLNPFSKNSIYTPSILLVMIRTLEYTGISYKGSRLKYADIYMYPEMLKFKRTDFHRASEILDSGYETARTTLLEWLSRPGSAERRPDLAGVVLALKGEASEISQGKISEVE